MVVEEEEEEEEVEEEEEDLIGRTSIWQEDKKR